MSARPEVSQTARGAWSEAGQQAIPGQRSNAAVYVLIGLLCAWGLGFWSSLQGIVSIWMASETFAHGFVVLPISAYLIWLRRDALRSHDVRPGWHAAPLVAVALVCWLLGKMFSIAVLEHVSAVMVLVCAAALALGRDVFRTILFPVVFLLFMAPAGDFLVPTLMRYTADVTVAAIRLSGVPVFQEGNNFVLPNGRWSVVEACSGIRYLIASFMVGTLYAYLNYRSTFKRVTFGAFALILPIVANWFRAYMIVMLGYLSNNRIAAGFDHLIYGWVFFGFVVILMFWIGNRWAEPGGVDALPSGQALAQTRPRLKYAGFALACAFFVGSAVLGEVSAPRDRDMRISLRLPAASSGWQQSDGLAYTPNLSGYRALASQAYRSSGGIVDMHVAVYAHQVAGKELVSWANRLTPVSPERWRIVDQRADRLVDIDSERLVVDGPAGEFTLWSWYQIADWRSPSDVTATLVSAYRRLVHGDDFGARVILAVPGKGDEASALALAYIQAHGPGVSASINAAQAASR